MVMSGFPWILIAILVLIILLGVVAFALRSKKKRPTDYYTFYIMGIMWTVLGIPLHNYALSVVGVVLAIVGIAHRKSWKQNRFAWNDVDAKERMLRLWVMLGLGLLVAIGLVVFFVLKAGAP